MTDLAAPPARPNFAQFYRDHFLAEHHHPVNVALHVFGTVASAVFVPAVLWSSWPWLVLAYPLVHAAPGLIGHRLFERNAEVGDVRVLRTDFSPLWFIAANHVLSFERLRALLRRANDVSRQPPR
jgi:hypothetical protein